MKHLPKSLQELIPKDKADVETAQRLKNYHYEEINEILRILRGTDEGWKYWCVSVFGINGKRTIDLRLVSEFERIAKNPTEQEVLEEVHELAMEFVNSKKTK